WATAHQCSGAPKGRQAEPPGVAVCRPSGARAFFAPGSRGCARLRRASPLATVGRRSAAPTATWSNVMHPPTTRPPRSTWSSLTEDQLLAQCEVDTYRASGPGGQKRNKTSSAVRLRHPPTGLIVIAEESRSQHENKARALRRLRRALFLKLRDPEPADGWLAHPDFRDARGGD